MHLGAVTAGILVPVRGFRVKLLNIFLWCFLFVYNVDNKNNYKDNNRIKEMRGMCLGKAR